MNELPYYPNHSSFVKALKELQLAREANKVTSKRQILTEKERESVLNKTDRRCHVCGIELTDKFQADHLKCHSSGGDHDVNNYLPSCNLCNNYRWHYSPEEIQWILKLGVWAKTQIVKETKVGEQLSTSFIGHEMKREERRRNPRNISN